jgi:hypothetical protein
MHLGGDRWIVPEEAVFIFFLEACSAKDQMSVYVASERKHLTSPPESEISMATQAKSYNTVNADNADNTVNAVFNVPDPDNPLYNVQAEVGGTATWNCNTPDYVEFEIIFVESNPVDSRKKATFRGTKDQPVVLSLKTAALFNYKIRHIRADGTHKVTGPYSLGVAPPEQFDAHCKGCPPVGPGI